MYSSMMYLLDYDLREAQWEYHSERLVGEVDCPFFDCHVLDV
jgi:hypothetical protein